MKSSAALLAVLAVLGASTFTQAQTTNSDEHNQTPTYSVNVVSRTTRAVKYEHRSGSTKIDFEGTRPDAGRIWRSEGREQARHYGNRS